MGRKGYHGTKVKNAWIDEQNRIISFTRTEEGEIYLAEENAFWTHILHLMHQGYRMQ